MSGHRSVYPALAGTFARAPSGLVGVHHGHRPQELTYRLQCSYYAGMTAITIRNVPSEVRDELASRAARSGRSLQEYLAAELAELARRPDVHEAIAAARSRARLSERVMNPDDIVADRDRERR